MDLTRWTLFFSSEDDLVEHTIKVPELPVAAIESSSTQDSQAATDSLVKANSQTGIVPSSCSIDNCVSEPSENVSSTAPVPSTSVPSNSSMSADSDTSIVPTTTETSATIDQSGASLTAPDANRSAFGSSPLKTVNVSHGFGVKARVNGATSNGKGTGTTLGKETMTASNGKSPRLPPPKLAEHVMPTAAAGYDGVKDTAELITILLEARCRPNIRAREDSWRPPVMVSVVSNNFQCFTIFIIITSFYG